jgi:hypothetical protein
MHSGFIPELSRRKRRRRRSGSPCRTPRRRSTSSTTRHSPIAPGRTSFGSRARKCVACGLLVDSEHEPLHDARGLTASRTPRPAHRRAARTLNQHGALRLGPCRSLEPTA